MSVKDKCNANEEVMFFKEWRGTTSGCVRHNKYGPDWISMDTGKYSSDGRYLQAASGTYSNTGSFSTMDALDIFVYDQGACKRSIWSKDAVI